MESLGQILQKQRAKEIGKYVTQEWQLYGYKLANILDDPKRVSLYMRLAKNEKREVLQKALDFVKESKPRIKSNLFLWKLKNLKEEKLDDNSESEKLSETINTKRQIKNKNIQ